MKARIKEDASLVLSREMRRIYHNTPFPPELRKYLERLRELAGKELEVIEEYNDRIVLKYPEPINDTIGIDVEKRLVEIVKEETK